MKRIFFYLMTIGLLLAFTPNQSNAATSDNGLTLMVEPKTAELLKAEILLQRLDEINAMDKSALKSPDKKNLRKEVRSIESQLANLGNGVYVSAGAIIVIVILLIILL
ncbi:MAG: hypothetical protein R6W78_16625 [Bacteroidales bacterium]